MSVVLQNHHHGLLTNFTSRLLTLHHDLLTNQVILFYLHCYIFMLKSILKLCCTYTTGLTPFYYTNARTVVDLKAGWQLLIVHVHGNFRLATSDFSRSCSRIIVSTFIFLDI